MSQWNRSVGMNKNSNEVSKTSWGGGGGKTIKTLSCCSLIDKFMWGDLYRSNITLVARNNTSRWMECLIFCTDQKQETASASVFVCVSQYVCTYIWALCVCLSILCEHVYVWGSWFSMPRVLAQRKSIRFRGQIINWHQLLRSGKRLLLQI